MASKPVANTMTSTSKVRLSVSMPEAVIDLDRLLPQVHQRDVGTVVGGVVVGIEAGTLGPERMVMRAQRCRRFRVLDGRTDFLADQLGDQRVAFEVDPLVGPQLGQHADEVAGGPRFLEPLAPLGIAQLPAERRLSAATARRPATREPARGSRRGRLPARRGDPLARHHCGREARSSACAGTRSDAPPARRSTGSPGCPTIPCR